MKWEKNNKVSEEGEYGGRDVHSETTGGKETGGTGEYGSRIHRP